MADIHLPVIVVSSPSVISVPVLSSHVFEEPQTVVFVSGREDKTERKCRKPFPEFTSYGFSEEIMQRCIYIWDNLKQDGKKGERRGEKKLYTKFFCAFTAHDELGVPITPSKLAKIMDLPKSAISTALASCSQVKTGYRPKGKTRKVLAIEYIPEFAGDFSVSGEATSLICKRAQTILDKDPSLSEKSPQLVAAGLVLYLLPIFGVTIDAELRSNVITFSAAAMKDVNTLISLADNR